jgi:predicted TIM-barrel fold metal-dependent hydrolase
MKKYFKLLIIIPMLFLINSCKNEPKTEHYTGEVIDLHNHVFFDEELGAFSDTHKGTPEEIEELTKNTPIKKCGIITMAKKGQIEKTKEKNDRIITLAKNNAQFIPICSVHPDDGEAALAEMERVAKLGVRFIKLHPNTQHFDISSEQVIKVVEKAGTLNLIILIEGTFVIDANGLGKYLNLVIPHPKTKFIFTHMGGTQFSDMQIFMFLNKYNWYKRNVWFDIAATVVEYANSPYKEQLIWTMGKIGTDRILFGSDFPLYEPGKTLESFYSLGLPEKTEKQILHDNYYNILKIK